MVVDTDGKARRVYKNAQSTTTCIPIGIALHQETQAFIDKCFKPHVDWLRKVSAEGLPARGSQPAFPPGIKIVGCGDMAFLMKVVTCGGACKVKKKFCPYCECDGDTCLFDYVEGEERCKICMVNKREQCADRPVHDIEERSRKCSALTNELLDDYRRQHCNPEATIKAIVPQEPVTCFDGFDGETKKVGQCLSTGNHFR